MIEIRGYGLYGRILFVVFEMVIWSVYLFMFWVAVVIHQNCIALIVLMFFGLMIGLSAYLSWRSYRRYAVAAEIIEGRIHFTMIAGNITIIDPDRVVRVIQSTQGYRIEDDRRQSIYLQFVFWPKTPYNPWKPLMKPIYFQNAEFKDQLYYW